MAILGRCNLQRTGENKTEENIEHGLLDRRRDILDKLYFLLTIEIGCSRAAIFIQLALEGDTLTVEVKHRVCKEREPS
jgi:hypothetical protein